MRRFAWFDCLRCAAILLVIVTHSRDITTDLPLGLDGIFKFLAMIGWAGVDLFFVLSGFLVSGLLFDEHDASGSLNIRRFLIRRGFKIIPAFYVLTLATAIHDALAFHRVVIVHVLHDIFFLQSYREGAWAHAWTLAVEVHFYLLLAALLWYLARRPAPQGKWLARLPGIICGVLVLSFAARWINSIILVRGFNFHHEFQPTHLHLDVLAAGVLLRYVYTYHHERLHFFQQHRTVWIALGLLLVEPSVLLWQEHSDLLTALMPTLNYLGFGLILFQATQIPFPTSGWTVWLIKPFDYLGKHSYSIYLWHLPVKQWLIDPIMHNRASPLYFVFFVAASLAVGTFFSVILEMPILHLRNRLFPSKSRGMLSCDPGTKIEAPPEDR